MTGKERKIMPLQQATTSLLVTDVFLPPTQDPVTPLAPSAPYTPIHAVHPGVASLHSSPLHPSRHQYGATPGNRKTPAHGTPGRRPDVDLRAELEKHKSSLNYDD